jgi:hypothetical protein
MQKCTVARQFTLAYKTRKQDAAPSYSMTSSSLTAYNERGEVCHRPPAARARQWASTTKRCGRPQKSIISQRCMDIDKAVPQHMGISKAILENVIFVHQEDANWPLRESKVLVRYNTATSRRLCQQLSCAETEVRRHLFCHSL